MAVQTEIGKLIGPGEERDAIHIAVAPVVASHLMKAGNHIGLTEAGEATVVTDNPIGIVDPFLAASVKRGERFFMFLYPNTITSLKHNWTHPAFENCKNTTGLSASEVWLRTFADDVDAEYDEMMRVAATHCSEDDRWGSYLQDGGKWEGQSTPEEFWTHFAAVTGKTPKHGPTGIFSCSC